MNINILDDPKQLGEEAGSTAAQAIQVAISRQGYANIILATGSSQFATLQKLTSESIDWSRVRMFHLDEYIGLTASHPASFRRYLKERFLQLVPPLLEGF